jgi:hypothetical protein
MLRIIEDHAPNDSVSTTQSRIFNNTVTRISDFALTLPSHENVPNVPETAIQDRNFCCMKSNCTYDLESLLRHTLFDVYHVIMRDLNISVLYSVTIFNACYISCQTVSLCGPVELKCIYLHCTSCCTCTVLTRCDVSFILRIKRSMRIRLGKIILMLKYTVHIL